MQFPDIGFSRRHLILFVIVVFALGQLAGFFVRQAEIESLHQAVTEQSNRAAELVSGISLDAVILEDGPLLQTIIDQAVLTLDNIDAMRFENRDHVLLAAWQSGLEVDEAALIAFTKTVAIEGEVFGYLKLEWDIAAELTAIEERRTQTWVIVSAVGFIFSLLVLAIAFYGLQVLQKREGQIIRTREARQRAEQESDYKTQFIARMNHELRTPLNAIIGFSAQITEGAVSNIPRATLMEYGDYIHRSGEHLLDIVNDILDSSKVAAGKMILQESRFSVADLVEDTARLLSHQAAEKGMRIRPNVRVHDDFILYADQRLCRQILFNVIGNAVKYAGPGAGIEITCERPEDETLHIAVHDNGTGIEAHEIELVLEPYGQAKGSARPRAPGLACRSAKTLWPCMAAT